MLLLLALVLLVFLPSPWNLVGALASGAGFAAEVGYWHRRTRERKVQTGVEELVGSIGDVTEPLAPTGQVRVLGELWSAHAGTELPRGTRVRVLAVQDLTLEVEAAKPRLNGRSPTGE